jgi:hypothetical protein
MNIFPTQYDAMAVHIFLFEYTVKQAYTLVSFEHKIIGIGIGIGIDIDMFLLYDNHNSKNNYNYNYNYNYC